MNKELEDKWLEALRSDDYIQVTGFMWINLQKDKPLCCAAGLLCHVAHVPKIHTKAARLLDEDFDEGYEVLEEIIRLNDRFLYPFPIIADWIEDNISCST